MVHKKLRKIGHVFFDWKATPDVVVEDIENQLAKEGIIFKHDPEAKGSDGYGYIIKKKVR